MYINCLFLILNIIRGIYMPINKLSLEKIRKKELERRIDEKEKDKAKINKKPLTNEDYKKIFKKLTKERVKLLKEYFNNT